MILSGFWGFGSFLLGFCIYLYKVVHNILLLFSNGCRIYSDSLYFIPNIGDLYFVFLLLLFLSVLLEVYFCGFKKSLFYLFVFSIASKFYFIDFCFYLYYFFASAFFFDRSSIIASATLTPSQKKVGNTFTQLHCFSVGM